PTGVERRLKLLHGPIVWEALAHFGHVELDAPADVGGGQVKRWLPVPTRHDPARGDGGLEAMPVAAGGPRVLEGRPGDAPKLVVDVSLSMLLGAQAQGELHRVVLELQGLPR